MSKTLHLPNASSQYQFSDQFIKAMTKAHHEFLASKLMLFSTSHKFDMVSVETERHITVKAQQAQCHMCEVTHVD